MYLCVMEKLITAIKNGFVLEQIYYFADDVEVFTLIDLLCIEDDIEITKKQWQGLIKKYDFKSEVVKNDFCVTVLYFFKLNKQ